MTRYIKGKNGQFTGSIGTGKNMAPSPTPPIPAAAPPSSPVPATSPVLGFYEHADTTINAHPEASGDAGEQMDPGNPWIEQPVDTVRYLYENLQPRINACRAAHTDPHARAALTEEDSKYRTLMATAAELSLYAKKNNEHTLSSLWNHFMEYTRYAVTTTWDSPSADSQLTDIASDVVEFVLREETTREYLSRGYDRALAETLEEWHRRSGGRHRGWDIDGH